MEEMRASWGARLMQPFARIQEPTLHNWTTKSEWIDVMTITRLDMTVQGILVIFLSLRKKRANATGDLNDPSQRGIGA